MSTRKQGLALIVAGSAILCGFLQATALQSLMGGATGLSWLFSQIGPFLCLTAVFLGLYLALTGSPLGALWKSYARLKISQRWGAAVAFLMTIGLLVHLIFANWATTY